MKGENAILVTGGAGYVGSHACKALARAGYLPVTVDNLSRGHAELVKWGPLIVADLADRPALDAAFAAHRPAAVMHFAAYAFVPESVADPYLYYRNNFAGTLTLLEAARAAGVNRFVFSSTCAVYGAVERTPIPETTPTAPVNAYGDSKLMIERVLGDAGRAYGLAWTALRYFNACGADPDGETGEMHDPEPHLIPRALMAATGEIPHLDVFGEDWPTPDGTCVRDYIHVADLAQAHVAALRRLEAGGESGPFNLGTGTGLSVREIVDAVERITGRKLPLRKGPRRPGDPPALVADPARARAELGFAPAHSDIDTVVRTAWRWYRARRNI
jgi:UDP-arabinose 4-epimerase